LWSCSRITWRICARFPQNIRKWIFVMRRWFVCQKYIPERLSLQRIRDISLFTGVSRTNQSLSCTRDSEQALDAVRKGESIVVTFGHKKQAVAIVSPVPTKGTKRPLGLLARKTRVVMAVDWEINESQFLGP
jgi:hypothetical protein